MKKNRNHREQGIALISVLLVLILLSIMAIGLMYVADTDTAINFNYRREQQSFFAAKAGIEEVRDRMRRTNPNSLDLSPTAGTSLLPTTVASDAGGVLYVINQGADPIAVQPWTAGNKYQDDELCHDGYVITGIPNPFTGGVPTDDVRCPHPPIAANTWYTKPNPAATGPVTSTAPFNGTAAALPYKWVRVTWKQDNSIQGNGTQPYSVDGTATNSSTAATPVCWDGTKEVLLQAPATACEQMTSGLRPVFLVTSLAITNGSRRMVQAELAKTMVPTFPAALALDGPEANANFIPVTSNNSTFVGTDAAPTPCPPAGNWPSIGTYTDYDASKIATAVSTLPAKANNWRGGPANSTTFNAINIGPWGNVSGQYADGTTGTVNASCSPTINSPFCPGMMGNLNQLDTISGLIALQNTLTQGADTIVPAGGTPTLPMGTDTNPKITVIQGDFSYSGNAFIGAGTLLVEGKVTISGSPTFDGIVYIVGQGYLNTSGTANYGGQVFIANIATPPPNPPDPNILPVLKAVYGPSTTQYPPWVPGSPTFIGGGGGGNGGVNYNSCLANLGNDRIPYKILATREILY